MSERLFSRINLHTSMADVRASSSLELAVRARSLVMRSMALPTSPGGGLLCSSVMACLRSRSRAAAIPCWYSCSLRSSSTQVPQRQFAGMSRREEHPLQNPTPRAGADRELRLAR